MGSHNPTVAMIGHACLLLCLLAYTAGQLCNTVQDPIKRDEGEGPWNVSRVERGANGRNGKLVPLGVNHPLPHAFYEGDSYVMQYSVRKGRKPDVIYFWQGSKSSRWEKGASAILTVDLDNKNGGVAKQARVDMNQEPGHFLNIFKGTFVTLLGGVERAKVEQDKDGVMLFRVKAECNNVGNKKPLVRTNQVEEVRTNVNDEDVFILDTPKKLFMFVGKTASPEEKTAAVKIAKSLFPKKSPEVSEGAQPSKDFLSNLKA